jgi:hypothetical protein
MARTFAAVTRHTGLIVDQRKLLADQPVEQGRLADIRTADQCDGERHDEIDTGSRSR